MAEIQHTEIGALTKACTRCGRTFPASLEFFCKHPSGKFGLQAKCRKCANVDKLAHYRTPEGQKAVMAYRAKHAAKIYAYNNSRPPLSEAKREEGRRRANAWYHRNKDRARDANKKWFNTPEGKMKNRLYQNRYQARRLQRDSEYALRKRTFNAISTALRQGRAKAKGRWWEAACGYSLEELRQHMERQFAPGMTWENKGRVWEIDHIGPISGFVIPDVECAAFREAWGLANLQPLFKADNRAKGPKRAIQ